MVDNILLILDESENMVSVCNEVIKMYKYFLYEQKHKNPHSNVTLYMFNTLIRPVYQSLNITDIGRTLDYNPRGGCAIYDSVCTIISHHCIEKNTTVYLVTAYIDNFSKIYNETDLKLFVSIMIQENVWNFARIDSIENIIKISDGIVLDNSYFTDQLNKELDELSMRLLHISI